ncbi:MAG TPA: Crp/Fnr family transcriptional regulator [Chitinophagaceae bacterium]|jgi:CRP-like cAMP-binding protein|nr:Crp/Fnr family transcriptional regulator [Chitinophagaceae bacterium]
MEVNRSDLSQKFIDLFVDTLKFTDKEFDSLLSHFSLEYIPKKCFYLKAGNISKQKAYINKGSTRTFTVDAKGHEHILFFSFEDWWIADFESYYTQQPAKQYIQATEDCELLCISKCDLDKLEEQNPKLKAFFEEKKQKKIVATMNNLSEVKSLTAEERYLNLVKKHPEIFQRIPLQYIASYLDIEAQSLSRLRSRLSKK